LTRLNYIRETTHLDMTPTFSADLLLSRQTVLKNHPHVCPESVGLHEFEGSRRDLNYEKTASDL
jgi:hypothetical protein